LELSGVNRLPADQLFINSSSLFDLALLLIWIPFFMAGGFRPLERPVSVQGTI
jgi:hypothetical protein